MLLGRLGVGIVAAAALACACCAAASAQGDLFAEYSLLAQQQRTPPPLVPMTMPGALGGAAAVPATVLIGAHGTYSLNFRHLVAPGRSLKVDAGIQFEDIGTNSLAGRRDNFGDLVATHRTRVRGHPGLTLRARFSPVRGLVWREQGRLYELTTNTPRRISMSALRAVANGLVHLLGGYTAQFISSDGGIQEAELLLTDRAVNASVTWAAPCTRGAEPAPDRGTTASAGWIASSHGAYSRAPFTVPGPAGTAPWTLSLSGGVGLAGGNLTFQAASAAGAEQCAIGPLALGLVRLPLLRKPGT